MDRQDTTAVASPPVRHGLGGFGTGMVAAFAAVLAQRLVPFGGVARLMVGATMLVGLSIAMSRRKEGSTARAVGVSVGVATAFALLYLALWAFFRAWESS